MSIGGVIQSHDVVIWFFEVPDLLACLGGELIEVSIGVGD